MARAPTTSSWATPTCSSTPRGDRELSWGSGGATWACQARFTCSCAKRDWNGHLSTATLSVACTCHRQHPSSCSYHPFLLSSSSSLPGVTSRWARCVSSCLSCHSCGQSTGDAPPWSWETSTPRQAAPCTTSRGRGAWHSRDCPGAVRMQACAHMHPTLSSCLAHPSQAPDAAPLCPTSAGEPCRGRWSGRGGRGE